jgi:hypothetical protein
MHLQQPDAQHGRSPFRQIGLFSELKTRTATPLLLSTICTRAWINSKHGATVVATLKPILSSLLTPLHWELSSPGIALHCTFQTETQHCKHLPDSGEMLVLFFLVYDHSTSAQSHTVGVHRWTWPLACSGNRNIIQSEWPPKNDCRRI